MAILSSNEVRALKRPGLQALAKKHGIKANTKNVQMVEELLAMFPDGVPTEPVVVESASRSPSPVRATRAPSPSLGPEPHAHPLPTPAPHPQVFFPPPQAPQVAAPANLAPPGPSSQVDHRPVAAPANLAPPESIPQAPGTSGQAFQLGAEGSFSHESARSRSELPHRAESTPPIPHQEQLVNDDDLNPGIDDNDEDTGDGQPQEEPVQEEQDVLVETVQVPAPRDDNSLVGDDYMVTATVRMRAVSKDHNVQFRRLQILMKETQRILTQAKELDAKARQEAYPMYREAMRGNYAQNDIKSFPNAAVYGPYIDTGLYADGKEREIFKPRVKKAQADEAQAGEAQAGEAQAGEAQAGEAQAGEAQAGEAQAGEAQAGEAQAGEAQVGEAQAGEAQASEAQAGGAQAGEAQAGTTDGREAKPIKVYKKLAADVYQVEVVDRSSTKRSRDCADDIEADDRSKRSRLALEGLMQVVHGVGSSDATALSDFTDSIPPQSRRQSGTQAREWSSLPPSSPPPPTSSSHDGRSPRRYSAAQKGKGRAR